MERRQRIGLYGSGEIPRSRRLRSRAAGPSRGLRDLAGRPAVRRMRLAGAGGRTMAVTAVMSIAATMVVVLAVLSATTMAPSVVLREQQEIPPFPYLCVGTIYDRFGTPVDNAAVTVTDLDTGGYNNSIVSGYYMGQYIGGGQVIVDLIYNLTGGSRNFTAGDDIQIDGILDIYTGTNSTTAPASLLPPYMYLNLTLSTVIPEFGDVLVPAVGMLGLFVTLVLVARTRRDD